tara:strand:+ start:5582 stop:6493 length:912 start_codon:yes stop_codon:yes gene_type:complete
MDYTTLGYMNKNKKNHVGFIGLGIMGKPMVKNLLKAEVDVYFYARKKSVIKEIERLGGTFVPRVVDIPKYTDMLITNLPKTCDVEKIVTGKDGLIKNLNQNAIVIDMSTISPEKTIFINSLLKKKGGFFLDAPVSGGEAGAISGELSIMVGGDKSAFNKAKKILSIIGEKITYIGESGSGQICKACNQILVAKTIHSVSEIITIAKKSKINPSIIRTALLAGYGNSKILEIHGKRMISSDYQPGFKLSLHNKDLKIAKKLLKSLGLSLSGLNKTQNLMDLAEKAGLSELDSSVIHSILEKTYK